MFLLYVVRPAHKNNRNLVYIYASACMHIHTHTHTHTSEICTSNRTLTEFDLTREIHGISE